MTIESTLRRALAFTGALSTAAFAQATVITTWIGPWGGSFGTASNWTLGVPASSDFATFSAPTSYLILQMDHEVGSFDAVSGTTTIDMNGKTLFAGVGGPTTPTFHIGASSPAEVRFRNGTVKTQTVYVGESGGAGGTLRIGMDGIAVFQAGQLFVGLTKPSAFFCHPGSSFQASVVKVAWGPNAASTMELNGSAPCTIQADCTLGVNGDATLSVLGGSVLTIAGPLYTASQTNGSAAITVAGESSHLICANGGFCAANGPTVFNVRDGGRITFGSWFTTSNQTTFAFRLEPEATGLPARVAFNAPVVYNPATTLSATLEPGYLPPIGTVFHLAQSVTTVNWTGLALPPATLSRRFVTQSTHTTLEVVVKAGLADLNGDNVIDSGDIGVLLSSWGGRGPSDLDLDGVVGPFDLALLLSAF